MNISAWIILVFILLMIMWDVLAMVIWGTEATVSWDLWEVSRQHPIIPFAAGVVVGHVLWPNGSKD